MGRVPAREADGCGERGPDLILDSVLEGILRQGGSRMGTTYAALFEVYSMVWGGGDED